MARIAVKYSAGVIALALGAILFHMKMEQLQSMKKLTNAVMIPNDAKQTLNTINQSMYACAEQSDCWKFQKMLTENWDSKKPKAAVYILSRSNDVKDLKKTLKDLETNFLSKYRYPVIIFHEHDFIRLIREVRDSTKLDIFFQEVQFELPAFLYPSPSNVYECRTHGIGYHHMCRFHAKLIYDIPIMRNLDYYLRLDAHSYINKPVPRDLFKYMKDSNLLYLYPCTRLDQMRCVRYLWDAANLFVKVKRIQPHFLKKMKNGLKIFYNNFEMARMDVFRGLAYQNYIHFIDQLGGTFFNRWGDAPIKSLAVSIFIPENQTRHVYDIAYKHKRFQLTHALSSKPPSDHC